MNEKVVLPVPCLGCPADNQVTGLSQQMKNQGEIGPGDMYDMGVLAIQMVFKALETSIT